MRFKRENMLYLRLLLEPNEVKLHNINHYLNLIIDELLEFWNGFDLLSTNLYLAGKRIWILCSRKRANYFKKLNLYLYAKNVLNIKICSEIILTRFLFFLVVCSLSTAKSPIINSNNLLFQLYSSC
jgi:hypothetical protein